MELCLWMCWHCVTEVRQENAALFFLLCLHSHYTRVEYLSKGKRKVKRGERERRKKGNINERGRDWATGERDRFTGGKEKRERERKRKGQRGRSTNWGGEQVVGWAPMSSLKKTLLSTCIPVTDSGPATWGPAKTHTHTHTHTHMRAHTNIPTNKKRHADTYKVTGRPELTWVCNIETYTH